MRKEEIGLNISETPPIIDARIPSDTNLAEALKEIELRSLGFEPKPPVKKRKPKKLKIDKIEEQEWGQFMMHLRKQAMKDKAPAAVMDLYAVLKGKKIEKREVRVGLSADEVVKRNLEAERALREGGYLEE